MLPALQATLACILCASSFGSDICCGAQVGKARAYYGCMNPEATVSNRIQLHPVAQAHAASHFNPSSDLQQPQAPRYALAASASASDLCQQHARSRSAAEAAVLPDAEWHHLSEDGSPIARCSQRHSSKPEDTVHESEGSEHNAALKRRRSQPAPPATPLSLDAGACAGPQCAHVQVKQITRIELAFAGSLN